MLDTCRGILLDIEGTTSSISFVHDVMFPYVREHLVDFLNGSYSTPKTQAACEQIARDAGGTSFAAWLGNKSGNRDAEIAAVIAEVHRLMDGDVKATGLKELQGLVWQNGFDSGALESQVYPDVLPAIESWRARGIDVRIYSSGSIAAQKLFFAHVANVGNCLHLFSGHYDTTIGSKREKDSYLRIAADWKLPPSSILFVSDLAAELQAAHDAGLQVASSIRPGNATLPSPWQLPVIHSFHEIQ